MAEPRRAGAPARLRLAAPAKINLGLRVLARRADGYHELESHFLPLDWSDSLEVTVGERPSGARDSRVTLQLEGAAPGAAPDDVPAGDDNLAVRAARAFLERAGTPRQVELRLRKRIPAGAGLGGGSSDAGAVLRALARLLPGALPPAALAELALELGADVPFFLAPRPARVGGIGERIAPLDPLPPLHLVLAGPGGALATARVFRAFDALGGAGGPAAVGPGPGAGPRSGVAADPAALPAALVPLLARMGNDLEPAARRLCPAIARLRRALEATGALAVGMTGSGPPLYGVSPDAAAAGAAQRALDPGPRRPGGAEWAQRAVTVQSEPSAPPL